MSKTKIQWTDETWNPIIGCHKISPGCDHCYAEKMANRIAHMNNYAGEMYRNVIGPDGKWNWETHLADSHMDYPYKLKKPKKIFVGSMTDIFLHSQSKQGRLDVVRLFSIMAKNPQHTFQILTKRPVEMKIFMDEAKNDIMHPLFQETKNIFLRWPLPNVWLGVTVCNQEEANFKIPILLDTPAAVRFVSIEPMLGPISLLEAAEHYIVNIDWVICGAETGPGARLIKWEWVYGLLGDIQDFEIPFFFKSWGKLKIEPNQIDTFKQFPK
jgi:protein gp37